jgi:hypothetical protein
MSSAGTTSRIRHIRCSLPNSINISGRVGRTARDTKSEYAKYCALEVQSTL